jgi:CHAT domain-containing protein
MPSVAYYLLRRPVLQLALTLLLTGATTASAPIRAQGGAAQALLSRGQQLWNDGTRDSLEASLAVYGQAQSTARAQGLKAIEARALLGRGATLTWLARTEAARAPLQEAREIFKALGDRAGVAEALSYDAYVVTRLGDTAAAIAAHRQAIDLARQANDRRVEALALHHLGWTGTEPGLLSIEEKRAAFETAVAIRRTLPDKRDLALSLCGLGWVAATPADAIPFLDEALAIARSVKDPRATGFALSLLAWRYGDLGNPDKSFANYAEALPLHRLSGHREQEPYTLQGLSSQLYYRGRVREALQYRREELAIRREIKDLRDEGASLSSIGTMLNSLGDSAAAKDYLQQALVIHRRNKNRTEEGTTFLGLAAMSDSLSGLELSQQALAAYRDVKDEVRQGWALRAIGQFSAALGRYREGIEAYRGALQIAKQHGSRVETIQAERWLGTLYALLGDRPQALDHLQQAYAEATAGKYPADAAVALSHMAGIRLAEGDPVVAQELLDRALPLARQTDFAMSEARVLDALAQVALATGRADRAVAYLDQALAARRRSGGVDDALAYTQMGKAHVALGDRTRALDWYRRALASSRSAREPAGEALTLVELMHFWNQDGQRAIGAFYGKQAINLFEQARANLRQLDLAAQRAYVNARSDVYRELADLLITDGRLVEAQQVLNLLKDQEFLDFVRRDASQRPQGPAQVAATAKEAAWQARYAAISDRIAEIGRERGELLAIRARTADEERRLDALEKDLVVAGEGFSQFLDQVAADLGREPEARARVYELREAQGLMEDLRELGHGAAALYTLVGRERYRVVLVTPDARTAGEYAITADELNRKVLAFRQALEDPRSDVKPLAQDLYRILVGPIAGAIDQAHAQTLMWSLDGTLRYLPLAALHDGEHYLAERYRSVLFTPASNSRLKDPPTPNRIGLGAGVSKASADFGALPAVSAELRGIFGAGSNSTGGVLKGQVLLDEAFTAEAFRASLRARRPVVHIATHFQFRPGNETDSFLVLGDGNRLTLADLRSSPNLFGGVELLTLSACNTAVGDNGASGAEVEGAAVLAQRNGAKAVVASLWPVADDSTRVFMETFYRARTAARATKASALREAQLALLRGGGKSRTGGAERGLKIPAPGATFPASADAPYAHPFYWAPFTLIGNWK